jgi:HAMP domain-containing protein
MIPYTVSIKYMLAGFTAIFLVLVIYLISLFVRWRRLKRDLQTLEELEKQL